MTIKDLLRQVDNNLAEIETMSDEQLELACKPYLRVVVDEPQDIRVGSVVDLTKTDKRNKTVKKLSALEEAMRVAKSMGVELPTQY